MKKEQFSLEIDDGSLTVSGERKPDGLSEGVEYHRSERAHGRFSRSFYLPQTVGTTVSKPPIVTAFLRSMCRKRRKRNRARSLSA